ncbi:hypothetical protein Tsubulata_016974 [Turnera subulata]|uniref:Uncharacterized protein n=1 Tax=Turnera subulata TaxID=218843 RepID=A0A9Q0J042_9ROSI|nr:hypothetical protein Tsubulata_016974 [Turnera subulata]
MGRRKAAPRPEIMLESTNLAGWEIADLQPQEPNSDKEKVEEQTTKKSNHAKPKRTASSIGTRQSKRLKNAARNAANPDEERIIEEVFLSDSDGEEDGFPLEPNNDESSLEERVQCLFEQHNQQKRTIYEMESKIYNCGWPLLSTCSGSGPAHGGSDAGDFKYRSLYFDSQKKIEALLEENLQLSKKLERALALVQAFEKGIPVVFSMSEMLKEMMLLPKAAGGVTNESAEPMLKITAAETSAATGHTSPKRKRRLGC